MTVLTSAVFTSVPRITFVVFCSRNEWFADCVPDLWMHCEQKEQGMAGILQIDNPQLSAIKDLLALVALKAQWDNGLHLGNINSSLEEIVRRLLNTVFDLKLINLN